MTIEQGSTVVRPPKGNPQAWVFWSVGIKLNMYPAHPFRMEMPLGDLERHSPHLPVPGSHRCRARSKKSGKLQTYSWAQSLPFRLGSRQGPIGLHRATKILVKGRRRFPFVFSSSFNNLRTCSWHLSWGNALNLYHLQSNKLVLRQLNPAHICMPSYQEDCGFPHTVGSAIWQGQVQIQVSQEGENNEQRWERKRFL